MTNWGVTMNGLAGLLSILAGGWFAWNFGGSLSWAFGWTQSYWLGSVLVFLAEMMTGVGAQNRRGLPQEVKGRASAKLNW